MRAGTLNRTTFLLRKKGTPTGVATVIYDALRERSILDPSRSLRTGTSYLATVRVGSSEANALAGNSLVSGKVWYFTGRR